MFVSFLPQRPNPIHSIPHPTIQPSYPLHIHPRRRTDSVPTNPLRQKVATPTPPRRLLSISICSSYTCKTCETPFIAGQSSDMAKPTRTRYRERSPQSAGLSFTFLDFCSVLLRSSPSLLFLIANACMSRQCSIFGIRQIAWI